MEFAKPQKYSARVSEKYYLTDNQKFLYVKFELISPDRMSFIAGQYVSVKINETGERRSYSIASTPDDNHGFHLLIEIIDGGKGSEFFNNIQIGQEVEVLVPLGKFVVSDPPSGEAGKLLFVATGSGIVPVWSMINDLLINKHETRPMRLDWGMRSEADLFFVDDLQRLSDEHSNFVFDIVLSRPEEEWTLCRGHVQDCLTRDFADGKLKGWEAYVCGKPELVLEISTKLVELGITESNIYHEKYA